MAELKYSQEVTSTDEHEEREGRSLHTRDHDVIRQWAESRGGVPASVQSTSSQNDPGILRILFTKEGEKNLDEITWDEWFEKFDEQGLELVYQEHKMDGEESTFVKLVDPNSDNS